MFRALLAHIQEALRKQQLVDCVRAMSVGCDQRWSQPTRNTHSVYQLLFVKPLLNMSK
jgi:hypothetical protein